MRKIAKIVYIILFLLIISFPCISMLWYEAPENVENRVLSQQPDIIKDKKLNINYFNQLSSYINDNFGYRQELVNSYAVIQEKLFNTSTQDIVIVGNDGWLYFNSTVNDYIGLDVATKRGVNNIYKTLSLIEEYVEGSESEFVLLIAPNKNSLYPENMPSNYLMSRNNSNISRLEDKLSNLSYLDLFEVFNNESEVLYHKKDSHWNNMGAAIVQDELFSFLGKDHKSFRDVDYTNVNNYVGDLDEALHPLTDYFEKQIVFADDFTFSYIGDNVKTTDYEIFSTNPTKKGSIIMFRDSFGNSLVPFVAEEFEEGYFTRNVPYRIDYVDKSNYDFCVLEIVERNLNVFQKIAPVMPAPLRTFEGDVYQYTSDKITIEEQPYENYIKLSGVLDKNYVGEDSNINVMLTSNSKQYVFEAFPVYEKDVVKVTNDYGYVIYLDKEMIEADNYQVQILTKMDGKDFLSTNIYELIVGGVK